MQNTIECLDTVNAHSFLLYLGAQKPLYNLVNIPLNKNCCSQHAHYLPYMDHAESNSYNVD